MRLLSIAFSLLAIFLAEMANAGSMWRPHFEPAPFPIQVAVVRTMGSGCPQGSVSAALSPDQSTVSILFDKLGSQLSAGSGMMQDHQTCTITLGVKFGGKYRVAIVGSDVRGYANVPAQATSSISIKHMSIYDIRNTFNFNKTLVGPTEQNIMMSNRFPQRPLWSQCGTQMKYSTQIFPFMFITIDVTSQTQNTSQDLISMIDSLDFSAAPLSYQLAWTPDNSNCPN